MALDALPQNEQIQIVEYVLHHRGASVSVTAVFEGALTMREARNPQAHAGTTTRAGALGRAAQLGRRRPRGEVKLDQRSPRRRVGRTAHAGRQRPVLRP